MAILGRFALVAALGASVACGGDDAASPSAAGGGGTAGLGGAGAGGTGTGGSGTGGTGGGAGAAGTSGGGGGAASAAGGSAAAGAAGTAGAAGKPATAECDPVAQTCPAGSTPKCTLVTVAGKNTPGCVDDHGTVGEGKPCKRDADGPAGFGHDDCAKGLFCTFIGVLPPSAGGTRMCRTLCHADASCPSTQRCAALDDAKPTNGFCGVTCDPFGTSCAAGLECSRLWPAADTVGPAAFLTCRLPGAKASGAACDPVAEDCVAGHVCVDPILGQSPACLPLCDDLHPCTKGTCVMPGGGQAGVCLQ